MNSDWRKAYEFKQRWFPCPVAMEDWGKCNDDMIRVANGAPTLLRGLLVAVWEEFEREYDRRLDNDGK